MPKKSFRESVQQQLEEGAAADTIARNRRAVIDFQLATAELEEANAKNATTNPTQTPEAP